MPDRYAHAGRDGALFDKAEMMMVPIGQEPINTLRKVILWANNQPEWYWIPANREPIAIEDIIAAYHLTIKMGFYSVEKALDNPTRLNRADWVKLRRALGR